MFIHTDFIKEKSITCLIYHTNSSRITVPSDKEKMQRNITLSLRRLQLPAPSLHPPRANRIKRTPSLPWMTSITASIAGVLL